MNYEHRNLAAGRWRQLSFFEQMANIGSEVERALDWQAKNNTDYCRKAAERALELMDLTLECIKGFPRLKELARVREAFADYFFATNIYMSTAEFFRKYFLSFSYAARRHF